MNALQRAIDTVGTQADLARAIGVKPQRVWNWLNRDKQIPAEMVISIEEATKDKHGRPRVLRHDLRPDLYPEEEAA